jgi:4,5-dihydroxyphthalate decarboxylase
MPPLAITFAAASYDRMLALRTGDVRPEGFELDFKPIEHVREIFDRMGGNAEFDAAEFSATEYIGRIGRGDRTFVALPVFPSRVFRHSFIFVNRRRINNPRDLAGKRIGVGLYTQTAAMWIRGILANDYGVDLSRVTWVQGAVEKAGSHGHPAPPPLLKPANIEIADDTRALTELLDAGAIDALVGTRVPACAAHNADIVRLFPNFWDVERDYYQRTKIHPIMHLVALRRDVHENNPWLAPALYNVLLAAKDHALKMIRVEGAPRYLLPWFQREVEAMDAVFGPDPWPYGIEANRPTLEALVRYMVQQHYIPSEIPLEELFVGERSVDYSRA